MVTRHGRPRRKVHKAVLAEVHPLRRSNAMPRTPRAGILLVLFCSLEGVKMKRREFMALVGSATAWPLAARAQQLERTRRISILSPGSSELSDPTFNMLNAFLQRLHELGYTEGENLTIERRFANGSSDQLRELAAELVRHKPDIIVAFSTTAALQVKQATATIPIVTVAMADPVADELVARLAQPGGNVTGTTFLGPELVSKRLQLLRELVPGLSRVAALWHPIAYSERTMAGMRNEIEIVARTLGLQLQLVPAVSPEDFVGAFTAMAREHAEALIIMPSPMLFNEYKRIVDTAANNRLPAIGVAREFVDLGGLLSYGPNLPDLARQTAMYANKILKGANPAELAVEQPTKFEFVVNLKAAKALGLAVPPALLARADEVIE